MGEGGTHDIQQIFLSYVRFILSWLIIVSSLQKAGSIFNKSASFPTIKSRLDSLCSQHIAIILITK